MADADPVVEALQREVEVVVGFELDDDETAGLRTGDAGDGEEVHHAAVGASEGGDLRVDVVRVEVIVECGDVAAEDGLEPALGLHAVEGIFAVAPGGATDEEAVYEFAEGGFGVGGERGLVGSGSEGDLDGLIEGVAGEAGTGAGELEAVDEEGEFGWGAELLLDCVSGGFWDEGEDAGDGFGETLLGGCLIWGVEEMGGEVAVVGGFAEFEGFVGLVEFVELPPGCAGVEPRETREGKRGCSAGNDEPQALIDTASGARLAAVMKPEDAEGEDAVDGGLGFFFVDGDDGPGLLALDERAAGVGGAEGFLEVHGGAKGLGVPVGEFALEDTVKDTEIFGPGGFAGGRGAAVLVGGDLEGLGFGLSEAMRGEAQDSVAEGGGGETTDEIAILAPEVEGAAAMFGRERVFGEA